MSVSAPSPEVVVPLVAELIPCPDPWDVARKLSHLPHLLFLDSAEKHTDRGRYSYVMADPLLWIEHDVKNAHGDDPFEIVRGWFNADPAHAPDELPPFRGGLAGLFGYGLARAVERIPENAADEFATPDLAIGLYDWVISFDHDAGRAWIVSSGYDVPTPFTRPLNAANRLNWLRNLLEHQPTPPSLESHLVPLIPLATQHAVSGFPNVTSNFSRQGYLTAVQQAIDYIHAGDIFQVNLSQRLLTPLTEHPLELYGRLRQKNPAPFACYFDMGDFQIVSASPERFLRVESGEIVTRPIKGTRPRGKTPQEDAALIHDLTTNPKDRAENVMIVDLLRNDIGRVAEFGSVTAPKVCEVESFRYVHHLVSEVRGKLKAGLTPLDLLAAAFPGGSVTGAPKVRAMEIIAELEPTERGPYCGSIGFIGFDGSMDTNILIRTFTAGRGWLQFPVGGGIVADSDPLREYEETMHKAAGLLRALEK